MHSYTIVREMRRVGIEAETQTTQPMQKPQLTQTPQPASRVDHQPTFAPTYSEAVQSLHHVSADYSKHCVTTAQQPNIILRIILILTLDSMINPGWFHFFFFANSIEFYD